MRGCSFAVCELQHSKKLWLCAQWFHEEHTHACAHFAASCCFVAHPAFLFNPSSSNFNPPAPPRVWLAHSRLFSTALAVSTSSYSFGQEPSRTACRMYISPSTSFPFPFNFCSFFLQLIFLHTCLFPPVSPDFFFCCFFLTTSISFFSSLHVQFLLFALRFHFFFSLVQTPLTRVFPAVLAAV